MVSEGQEEQLAKYLSLKNNEEHVTHIYRTRNLEIFLDEEEDDAGEEEYSIDLVDRERYVVNSTGAVLSYDNSLHLLGALCSQIPHDAFTLGYKPEYRGDLQSTLYLPRALPLPPEELVYHGPPKHSKKEAKRAVAFMAVKRLRDLDVFDEYLLPMSRDEDNHNDLSLTVAGKKHNNVPIMMTVQIRDPWCIWKKLWLHPVFIDGRTVAGLVTGTRLPVVEVASGGHRVRISSGTQLEFSELMEYQQRRVMEEFTKLGIYYNISRSPLTSRLSLYLIPITQQYLPDFNAMEFLLSNPRGCSDWSQVSESDYDRLMIRCLARFGSIHLLHRIRYDLSPMSKPEPGSREAQCSTFHEYWITKWSKKGREPFVSTEGPIVETWHLMRNTFSAYPLNPRDENFRPVDTVHDGRLLPLSDCVWLPISHEVCMAYEVLLCLCQRITDVYRVQQARQELGLPSIADNLLIEAFTIPSATFSFNNQRLETLGDAVLQVCTTVHLLHHYPNRHEGQLTKLRQKVVSNRYLLQRALELGLERFVTCEIPSMHKWRLSESDTDLSFLDDFPARHVLREYPRRSLQDCMEAVLGASFLTGGIPMALEAGTSMGLEFGGPLPWFMRYSQTSRLASLPPLFASLEEKLGYKFRYYHLLHEALTHPSAASPLEGHWCPSYQRLEFLGDGKLFFVAKSYAHAISCLALLNLIVVQYLYDKFPEATSHQLSFPRSKAVCSPTLAYLAVQQLELHKMMLVDSIDLNTAIAGYVLILQNCSAENIVKTGWKFDPPKALSDFFESLTGAIFIDSGYDYDKTAAVVEHVMEGVLEVLSPALAKDPISELMEWRGAQGCRKVIIEYVFVNAF